MEIDIPESITYMQDRYSFRVALAGSDVVSKINREDLTIDDVILIEVGEAEGHGFEVEAEFLTDLVKYVKKELGGRLPCNMGHQWDALWFQLGRYDKLKVSDDGRRVIAKLTCFAAADKSPARPGMLSWFLDMAESDPRSVMNSITFVPSGFYQYDEKGTKVFVSSTWWGGPKKQFEEKPVYAQFGKIYSSDIVAAGALTSTLFSSGSANMIKSFQSIINAPGFAKWMSENEEHFPVLTDYYERKQKFSLVKYFKSIFSIKEDMKDETKKVEETTADTTTATDTTETTTQEETNELAQLREELTKLKGTVDAQAKTIKELSGKPATKPVVVKDQDPPVTDLSGKEKAKSYELDPVTQKARKLQESMTPAAK